MKEIIFYIVLISLAIFTGTIAHASVLEIVMCSIIWCVGFRLMVVKRNG